MLARLGDVLYWAGSGIAVVLLAGGTLLYATQPEARARAIQGCQIGRVESPGKMKAPAFSRGFQRGGQ
jgi:hypothetical protein